MELLASKRLCAAFDPVMDADADALLTFLGSHFDFDYTRPKVNRASNVLTIIAEVPNGSLPKDYHRLGKHFMVQLIGRPDTKAGNLKVQVDLAWELKRGTRKMAAPIFIGTLDVKDTWDPRFSHASYNWN